MGEGLYRLIGSVVSGDHRHACRLHQRLGRIFEAHGADRICGWADEHQSSGDNRIHEVGVFGQEPVSGVNGLRVCVQGRLDDQIAAQVAIGHRGCAKSHGLIGLGYMQCRLVCV